MPGGDGKLLTHGLVYFRASLVGTKSPSISTSWNMFAIHGAST